MSGVDEKRGLHTCAGLHLLLQPPDGEWGGWVS